MTKENKELQVTKSFDVSDCIQGTDLLKSEDIEFLKAHANEFEYRFRTRSFFRSRFEMEASVLNEDVHPTPDSRYWQSIGEQNVHLTELISLSYNSKKLVKDIELKELEIEEKEIQMDKVKSIAERPLHAITKGKKNIEELMNENYETKIAQVQYKRLEIEHDKLSIELDEMKFNLKQGHKVAQERIREVKEWEDIIQNLHKQLKYGDEDFQLHHAERYFERYLRKVRRFDILTPDEKENAVSHFLSFAGHPDNKQKTQEVINELVNKEGMSPQHGLIQNLRDRVGQEEPLMITKGLDTNYESREIAMKDDPVVRNFFDRKVQKILVCSPHRMPGEKMVSNIFSLQTPAAFDCRLYEPVLMTVAQARTDAIKKALNEGYDYIFWIDDDLIIPRNTLVKLISHEADIVGGFYYRKYLPLESVGMREILLNNEKVPSRIKDYKIGDIIHNTLVLPSGLSLVKLDIFKNISEPWFRTVNIEGAPAITEDTYFCQKAKSAGYDIITDTGIQGIHVDIQNNKIYGHPEIVNNEHNAIINPQDYCLY